MYGDLPLLISIFISAPIYIAVLAKFIYDYKSGKMETVDVNTQKERIRILVICLVSLIPCPWYIGMNKLSGMIYSNWPSTLNLIASTAIYNTSLTLVQCIEEVCLVFISKDFRKMVKRQFVKNNQTTTVTTIIVSQNAQQSRRRQMNA